MPTVDDCAAVLVDRLSALLTHVGKDGQTASASNSTLLIPIGMAARQMGYPTAAVVPTNGDLAAIPAALSGWLYDLCTLQALYSIRGNMADWDQTQGPDTEGLAALADQCDRMIAWWTQRISALYGLRPARVAVGPLPNPGQPPPRPWSPPGQIVPDPSWPAI